MKCPHCNQEIDDDSQVCTACGKSLNETPVSSPADVKAEQEPAPGGQVTAGPAGESAEPGQGQPAAVTDNTSEGNPVDLEGKAQSSKKKWVLPAAIVAAIAIAAGVFAMKGFSSKDPKDLVIDAFKSIVAEGQTNPAEEIFGMSSMIEKLNKESSQVTMEFSMEGSSDETLNQLVSGTLGVKAFNDMENKKVSFDMGVGYGGMELANLKFYLDEKELVMAVPELSSRAFTMNYAEDLEGQLANSPFVGPMIQDSGMDFTGLNSYLEKCNEIAAEGTQFFDLKELWNRYKEGSQAIEDLKAAMTVEKAEQKTFTIDGKEENCNGYHTTITKDALVQFITTTKDFFLNDETLKNDFIEYMNLMNDIQGTMAMMANPYMQSGEEMQQELWNMAETNLNTFIEELKESMGDLTMDVYVRKDGKMAGFDYETTAVIEEENIKFYGNVTFGGGYSMMSNVNAVLNLESETGEVITLSADKTGTYEKDKAYSGAFRATAGNGTESYSFVYTGDYNVESKEYDVSLDFLSGDESQFAISSNGMFTDLVKGESFALEMTSIRMEMPVFETEEYVELSAKYEAGPLAETVEIPEGEKFDILAATEEDYYDVYTEITGNAISLMMKFY